MWQATTKPPFFTDCTSNDAGASYQSISILVRGTLKRGTDAVRGRGFVVGGLAHVAGEQGVSVPAHSVMLLKALGHFRRGPAQVKAMGGEGAVGQVDRD